MPNYTPEKMSDLIDAVVAKVAAWKNPAEHMNELLANGDMGDAWMFTAGCVHMVAMTMPTKCTCEDPGCESSAEPALAKLDAEGNVVGLELLADGVPDGCSPELAAFTRMLAADISQDSHKSIQVFLAEVASGGVIPLMREAMREAAVAFRSKIAAQQ